MNEQTTALAAAPLPPPMLLERAIQSGVTPDVLEKLMGLQERWQAQQSKAAFNAAMADMRATLPPIIKNQKVDFSTGRGRTSYQYEDLNDVTEVLTSHMAKFGLAFRWRTQPGDPVTVTCIVSHRDGHQEESSLSAPRDESGNKNAIQGLGSAITYLQRYTLKAALGVAAARDDDGNSAGQRHEEPRREPADRFYREPVRENSVETMVSKPVSQQTNIPAKATEKTREWMLGNLKQFNASDLNHFAVFKGWAEQGDALETWPLDHVPTNRQSLGELIREIEQFIAARAPQQDLPFSEPFWDAVITVPRAGMKRAEYLQHPDTVKGLYEAMKSGDEKARTRLWGLAREWQPQEWTGNDGQLRPPPNEDLACRSALDAFLEYSDARHEKS